MDELKRRYELKLIDLGTVNLTPIQISIADACAITFVRFARDQEMRYPQHYPHDFFQISIDNQEQYFPFRPYDTIKMLSGGSRFHSLKYRNLRAVDGFAVLLISYDMCPESFGRRQEITFPLKNNGGAEIHDVVDDGAAINIAAGVTTNIFSIVVPAATVLLLWDFSIGIYGSVLVDYAVKVDLNGVNEKEYGRMPRNGQDPSFCEVDFRPSPAEFSNSGIAGVNFRIRVHNRDGAVAGDFFGSVSYSFVPAYLQDPAAEFKIS